MRFTAADIRKLEQKGLKTDMNKQPAKKKVEKISVEKRSIETILFVFHREGNIPKYVREHQFHHERKFRFDWAIPDLMIAIEYEGLMSEKSGHTTISGYTKDCTKYNLAAIEGWKVLRYTAINYQDLADDLRSVLKN